MQIIARAVLALAKGKSSLGTPYAKGDHIIHATPSTRKTGGVVTFTKEEIDRLAKLQPEPFHCPARKAAIKQKMAETRKKRALLRLMAEKITNEIKATPHKSKARPAGIEEEIVLSWQKIQFPFADHRVIEVFIRSGSDSILVAEPNYRQRIELALPNAFQLVTRAVKSYIGESNG